MKYFLCTILFFSTLTAVENTQLTLQKLQRENDFFCMIGFLSTGAFLGTSGSVVIKGIYVGRLSEVEWREILSANSIGLGISGLCKDRCSSLQKKMRVIKRAAGLPMYVEKDPRLERLEWIESGRHLLLGMALGAALHPMIKGSFNAKNFQPHDIIVPTALITLSLVTAKIASDHVNFAHAAHAALEEKEKAKKEKKA